MSHQLATAARSLSPGHYRDLVFRGSFIKRVHSPLGSQIRLAALLVLAAATLTSLARLQHMARSLAGAELGDGGA